ncbi:Tectonic-2 [Manis javanica]|nr:Tectonic-2 [Manis javanica]
MDSAQSSFAKPCFPGAFYHSFGSCSQLASQEAHLPGELKGFSAVGPTRGDPAMGVDDAYFTLLQIFNKGAPLELTTVFAKSE